MPFLEQEGSRLHAEAQAIATEITALTTQLDTRRQAVAAAQARVDAAGTTVTAAQAQVPPLVTSAASADEHVTGVNLQIEAHAANEPEPTIERPNKPPLPNPAWRTWKREMDRLTASLAQAEAESAAAHTRLNNAQRAVAQAQAEVQAAEGQVAEATAAVQATQTAIAAVQERRKSAQQRLDDLERWRTEIARDPLDRPALEQVAAELTARTAALEEAHTIARFQNEDAEAHLAALLARRDELVPLLNDVNGRLPAAQTERQAARAALAAAARQIQTLLRQGPR